MRLPETAGGSEKPTLKMLLQTCRRRTKRFVSAGTDVVVFGPALARGFRGVNEGLLVKYSVSCS